MLRKSRGFTIVELLIVIVVIAILATIVTLSYFGVQNNAKTGQAKTNAYAVQKVAEAFYADKNRVPGRISDFSYNPLAKVPSGVTILTGANALTTDNGSTSIEYTYIGSSADTATGARLRFWDYEKDDVSDIILYVGNATSSSTGWTKPN